MVSIQYQPVLASTGFLRPASTWICRKIINAFSSGYQDLMGHLILTTSPWSVLTWITLVFSVTKVALPGAPLEIISPPLWVVWAVVRPLWPFPPSHSSLVSSLHWSSSAPVGSLSTCWDSHNGFEYFLKKYFYLHK